MFVPALVEKELPPGRRAISVETRVAFHAELGPEEEAGVWIDQQHRMPVARTLRPDGNAVRSARLIVVLREQDARRLIQHRRWSRSIIEGPERLQIDSFDIPTDAAFGEGQGHPGFEPRDYARMHV